MEKNYKWDEPGREKLELQLTLENSEITGVKMKSVGSFAFLEMSQKMKAKLKGPIANLLPPTGLDPSAMIWREMIGRIQEEWQSPVTQEELCHCRKVSTERVDRAIVYGAHSLDEIRKRTSANTGCGTCKNDVSELINYRLKI
jgi:bacterioferritin-associated ferredoxin